MHQHEWGKFIKKSSSLNDKCYLEEKKTKYITIYENIFRCDSFYIPLAPSEEYICSTFDQNFNFKIRRDHQKISYELRVYESFHVIS